MLCTTTVTDENRKPRQSVRENVCAASAAAEILSGLDARGVLFVVDRDAYRFSGAEEKFAGVRERLETATFDGFQINPKLEDVERGVALFREFRPDAIVAVGGGSALDMAKLVGGCGAQRKSPRDYVTGAAPLENSPPPTIAIPTTAGTGSEATHFAVVYVDGSKWSLANPGLRPSHAVLDPSLTYSLPKSATVVSGLDAICQAIESMWSVGATDASLADASASLGLVWRYLPIVANDPTPDSRLEMLRAAHFSGRAIDVTKTTAPHACSYALTSDFGVPHGLAVALTLGPFLRWNASVGESDCNHPRGADDVRKRIAVIVGQLGADSVERACRVCDDFLQRLGAPTRLSDVGVSPDDLPRLAEEVNVERLSNNPRRIERAELVELLRSIL